jgi:hypothetical protein
MWTTLHTACQSQLDQNVGAGSISRRNDEAPHCRSTWMDYLTFDLTEVDDGVSSLEAMASTTVAQHPAVLAEVRQVLDWAWRHYPGSHGPIDDGMDWDHDLQVTIEDGGWHTVTLTLTGTARFVQEFIAAFGGGAD